MKLSALSMAYACPHHNTGTTMWHQTRDIGVSVALPSLTPDAESAISPIQLESRLIGEQHSPPARGSSASEHWPSLVASDAGLE